MDEVESAWRGAAKRRGAARLRLLGVGGLRGSVGIRLMAGRWQRRRGRRRGRDDGGGDGRQAA